MFPLQKKKLIRGVVAHVNAGLGAAADYEANYIPFYIPFDGIVSTYYGKEGGNWLRLTRSDNGDKIELAHLSKYSVPQGKAKAGELGGITGNTGAITTRPHLHIQIINKDGKRLDPETYNWENGAEMLRTYKGVIYALVAGYWIAIATTYEEYLSDFGGIIAPEMTESQFKAFPIHKRTIK